MAIQPAPFVAPAAAPDPRRRVLVFGLLGLAFFLAWQALALKSFLQVENRPPTREEAAVLSAALEAGAGRTTASFYLKSLALVGAGASPAAALWLNWFYLALLGGALFGLAFHFRPDWSALPCALIFLCAPGVQELFYSVSPDLGLMAWVAASYWALVLSEDFRNWAWSLGFGLMFALGFLHQERYGLYLLPAFYVGLKALGGAASRWKALACALIALACLGPWFWRHGGALLAGFLAGAGRLPGFSLGHSGFFRYLLEAVAALGPPFWLVSLLGLLVPQFHRAGARGWLMTSWLIASYFFWSLVPGQPLRFLMPALPSLAVVGLGAWPVPLIWVLAAFQALSAGNYTRGWMESVSLPPPLEDVAFFVNDPASAEDWKLADILREVQRRHHSDWRQPAGLAVAARHQRFNADNAGWLARRLGLAGVSVRGTNDRFCEFSEFVLVKTGQPQTKELDQSWFSQAYAETGRWPLPDGSEAVLYQQRRLTAPPAPQKRYEFQYYETPGLAASGLRLELGPFDREKGVYQRALLSASQARFLGLELGAVSLELSDLAFVPLAGMDDLRFLRLGELAVARMNLAAPSLARYWENRLAGLRVHRLELGDGFLAEGRVCGLAFSARGAVKRTPEALEAYVLKARLGPLSLPAALLRGLGPLSFSLGATEQRPFAVRFPALTIRADRVSVP